MSGTDDVLPNTEAASTPGPSHCKAGESHACRMIAPILALAMSASIQLIGITAARYCGCSGASKRSLQSPKHYERNGGLIVFPLSLIELVAATTLAISPEQHCSSSRPWLNRDLQPHRRHYGRGQSQPTRTKQAQP
jgi:hypothetical protein